MIISKSILLLELLLPVVAFVELRMVYELVVAKY